MSTKSQISLSGEICNIFIYITNTCIKPAVTFRCAEAIQVVSERLIDPVNLQIFLPGSKRIYSHNLRTKHDICKGLQSTCKSSESFLSICPMQ